MADGRTPTIAARLQVRGTEQVRGAFEDVRKSGEQTFGSLRRSAQNVGNAVDRTAETALSTAKMAATTATVSVGAISSTLGGLASVAGGVVDAVLGIAGAVAKGALIVGGASVGAYAAARSWTTSVAEGNDEVARQAQAIGMSVESLSKWQGAVRIAGGDARAVTGAFESVRNKILDTAKGVEGADKAFRQLEISVRDSSGNLRDTEELFTEAVDNLAKIQDEGVRSAAAFDLFGSSANSLLPVVRRGSAGLRELQLDAESYGTALTTAQSAENDALLEKKRRMDEALKGASNRIADAFLPVFTASSLSIANWLEENGDVIESWATGAAETFSSLVRDVKRLFTASSAVGLENGWLTDLYGPAQALKDVILALVDAVAGRGVGQAPWLADLADTAGETWNVVKALLGEIRELTGIGDEGFSLSQSFRDARDALASFQEGLAGGTGDITWAANIGATVDEVSRAVGGLAGIVNDNRDDITSFATDTVHLLADGMQAVRGTINGEGVSEENAFAWLPALAATVTETFDGIRASGAAVWTEIAANWDALESVGRGIIDVMDAIAKSLGLGDWRQLGIILIVGEITGAFKLLGTLSTVFAGVAVFFNNLLGIFGGIGKFLLWIATGIATLTGAPLALVIGIGLALAAAVTLIVVFWDDIVALFQGGWNLLAGGFQAVFDIIGSALGGLGDLFSSVFGGIGSVVQAAWSVITDTFGGIADFFAGIGNAVASTWSGFWNGVGDGAQSVWDGITGTFGGIVDFFTAPLRKIGEMWSGLWDGVKDGAVGAWEAVKGFFGLGGDQQAGNNSMPSYDVGTARVPGADGTPMQAMIHGGERILTVAQNKQFGALIDSLVNMTSIPMTEFAGAPAFAGAGASSGGSSMSMASMPVVIGGRRYDGLQGSTSAVRSVRNALRASERDRIISRPRRRR